MVLFEKFGGVNSKFANFTPLLAYSTNVFQQNSVQKCVKSSETFEYPSFQALITTDYHSKVLLLQGVAPPGGWPGHWTQLAKYTTHCKYYCTRDGLTRHCKNWGSRDQSHQFIISNINRYRNIHRYTSQIIGPLVTVLSQQKGFFQTLLPPRPDSIEKCFICINCQWKN